MATLKPSAVSCLRITMIGHAAVLIQADSSRSNRVSNGTVRGPTSRLEQARSSQQAIRRRGSHGVQSLDAYLCLSRLVSFRELGPGIFLFVGSIRNIMRIDIIIYYQLVG
jgi:hypothetical protein